MEVFRGLKFEPDDEIGEKGALCKGLKLGLKIRPNYKAMLYRCQFILLNHSAVCFNPCANVKGGFQFSSSLILDESTAREPVSLSISCDFPVMTPVRRSIKSGR